MQVPEQMFYTKEHEWTSIDGNIATIGITEYAIEKLGDITFVELPSQGTSLHKDDTFGVVESVKAVSDLFSPVSGKVVETNEAVVDSPENIVKDPYSEGWLIKIEMSSTGEIDKLMPASAYKKYCEEEK